jgi:hypothetical protein
MGSRTAGATNNLVTPFLGKEAGERRTKGNAVVMIIHDYRVDRIPPHVPLDRHPEPEVQSGCFPAASGALNEGVLTTAALKVSNLTPCVLAQGIYGLGEHGRGNWWKRVAAESEDVAQLPNTASIRVSMASILRANSSESRARVASVDAFELWLP